MLYAGVDDVRVLVDVAPDLDAYFEACARVRNISKTRLMNRLVNVIGRDQLVLSILDDDSKPTQKQKHEHGYRPKIAP